MKLACENGPAAREKPFHASPALTKSQPGRCTPTIGLRNDGQSAQISNTVTVFGRVCGTLREQTQQGNTSTEWNGKRASCSCSHMCLWRCAKSNWSEFQHPRRFTTPDAPSSTAHSLAVAASLRWTTRLRGEQSFSSLRCGWACGGEGARGMHSEHANEPLNTATAKTEAWQCMVLAAIASWTEHW